jgi:hypothetical protein
MDAFQDLAEEEYVEKLAAYFRRTQPAAGPPLSDSTLHTMIRTGIQRAQSHGLTWQSSIAAFIATMFELGPTFDRYPKFRQILDDPGIPPNQRMDRIAETATAEDCTGAAGLYDMTGWFVL